MQGQLRTSQKVAFDDVAPDHPVVKVDPGARAIEVDVALQV